MTKYKDKNRAVTIILALLVGGFGVHKFYLREFKKGTIYLVLSWTGIPVLIGWYDAYKYIRNEEWFGELQNELGDTVVADKVAGVMKKDQSHNDNTGMANSAHVPDGAVMAAKGANGKITLFNDRLEISRDGIGKLHRIQHGFKGDKEIPYDSITSVQLRKPSSVTRGYIQFGQSGFSESDDGLFNATSDENTVLFDKGSLSQFEELRTKVRELKKGGLKRQPARWTVRWRSSESDTQAGISVRRNTNNERKYSKRAKFSFSLQLWLCSFPSGNRSAILNCL